MKSIRTIAILALLILFPLISYVYLKKGYNYRLEALKELEPKGKIELSPCEDGGVRRLCQEDLIGKTSILYNHNEEKDINLLMPVFEEFTDKNEFYIIGITKDSSGNSELNDFIGSKQWSLVSSDYELSSSIALVDTAANIRNYYEFDSTDFTKLGMHIPIILPRKKEKDIKMKNDK